MAIPAFFLRWRCWLGPLLVVLAGFVLRVAYYNESYVHPDEPITVEVVGHMRASGDWDTNWAKAPGLDSALHYDQYNFSSYLYATYFFYRAVKLIPGLEAWRSLENGFFVYRLFIALLATVVVWQTWSLARRVAGEVGGLAAGALVAVIPLLVQDAHFLRPEAFVTTLTLAAVMVSWPRERYSAWRVLGAAVILGILVACKFSMLALAWLPLVPAVSAGWSGWRGTSGRLLGATGLTLIGIALGFVLGAPGAMLHPHAFWNGVHYLTSQYAGLHPPHSHIEGGPVADMLARYFLTTIGTPALVLGAAGLAGLLVQRRWAQATMLAGPVVLFVGYFCTRSVFFERNLSHVVPLFCVLVGVGVVVAARALSSRLRGWFVPLSMMLGLLVVLRSAELSGRLVFTEFSRSRAAEHDAFEEKLRNANPEKEWWIKEILNPKPLDELVEHFEHGGKPIVLRVVDYHDPWSVRYGGDLPKRLNVRQIAEFPSNFDDVSGCTLHTYNSWTDRYYIVSGVKKP
jgi:hypothetical protein